jgi:hypothetical protein
MSRAALVVPVEKTNADSQRLNALERQSWSRPAFDSAHRGGWQSGAAVDPWRRLGRLDFDKGRSALAHFGLQRAISWGRLAAHSSTGSDSLDTVPVRWGTAVVPLRCLEERRSLRPESCQAVCGRRAIRVPALLSARVHDATRRTVRTQPSASRPSPSQAARDL